MAKEKQTRRMIAMALAAAVTMSSVPVVAFAEGTDTPPAPTLPDYIPAAPAEGETPVVKDDPINITIKIPATPDDPDTQDVNEGEYKETVNFGDPENTILGNPPEDENDREYDYEIVTQQGQITVEAEIGNVKEEHVNSDWDYVENETVINDTNDLYWEDEDSRAPEEYLPGGAPAGETPEEYPFESDGEKYQFEYVGTGNSSKFSPAVVFTEPMTDEEKLFKWGDKAYLNINIKETMVHSPEDLERAAKNADGSYVTDEDGFLLDENGDKIFRSEKTTTGPDGTIYYLKRINMNGKANNVEGWWEDGEWIKDLNSNKYGAVWGTAQQFVLVDKETGEVVTTYCADITNYTEMNFGYEMKNLEDEGDGGYYSPEQAAMLRAIASNGYWGTLETVQATNENGEPVYEMVTDEATGEDVLKLDEEGNPIPVMVEKPVKGSLEAMKQMLEAAGFTEEELASLTDGVALTATQMAIWSCSNAMMGAEFINSHYAAGGAGDVPSDKTDEVKLIFKIYEYLKSLDPISYEEEPTTADTIINNQNFLNGDLEITILEKVDDHENNQDSSEDNDAYSASVSFALVVQPATENGDDLVVSVYVDGVPVAQRRIAGENAEGEKYEYLKADENGNYTIDGITLIEGGTGQVINLSLEGVQNLKEGIFLFDSEIKNGGKHDSDVSQTMVGMAYGTHGVNVSQNVKFSFEVNDEKVVVRKSGLGGDRDPNPPTEIPDEKVPLIDIPDEETPLTETPEEEGMVLGAEDVADAEEEGMVLGAEDELIAATGDNNHAAAGFGGMLAALAGMFMLRRKKEN